MSHKNIVPEKPVSEFIIEEGVNLKNFCFCDEILRNSPKQKKYKPRLFPPARRFSRPG
jgi:hypothetical protein